MLTAILPLVTTCTMPQPAAPTHAPATPEIAGAEGRTAPREARETVDELASRAPDPDNFDKLLSTIGSLAAAPLYKGNRVDLLIDGPTTYGRMQKAIEHARYAIYLETYIFADDEVGSRFARQLMDKAHQGVRVCIIYDSVGSIASSDEFFEEMRRTGISLIEYNGINPIEGGNPLTANNRDHRKLLVVDDSVAFTGGINLSREYSSSSPTRRTRPRLDTGWRDTHIAVYGPAVARFRDIFRQQWLQQGGIAPDMAAVDNASATAGDDLVAVLDADGGDDRESSIYRAYIEAMQLATVRIWITQAYFAPDEAFLDRLKRAAARGVDVRLLVPGISDSSLVLYASQSRYDELLAQGVKIYEDTSSVLHAKTAVIDGIWSTVGSSNLDYRSFLHNDEINAVIVGREFADQMETQFLRDTDTSRTITLAQWRKRPLLDRVRETLSWSIEYWL